MQHTANTKIMGRFADTPNTRGLSIYNPYFEKAHVDAIYQLFVGNSAEKILLGVKYLDIAGGIVVGQHSSNFLEFVDYVDPHAGVVGSCNTLVNTHGILTAYSTDAEGLLGALESKVGTIQGARITILGGGKIVRGLLDLLLHKDTQSITIFNRTPEKIETLKEEFPFIQYGGDITSLFQEGVGDIFINATFVGSDWEGDNKLIFPKEFVDRFHAISDVTFDPLEPQLITTAMTLGKIVSPGWLMFLHQGMRQLILILHHDADKAFLEAQIKKAFRQQ